ncbi:MAG: thiamine pyrophosphate-dependent enzyme [Bacteroidales bacterium]|nr:thiamine pyrophosphate-dependent enzyme [Bacteroidales bacterium]
MAKKLLLLGDEAIAKGAIDSGLSAIYAYPGTPSTEIAEYIDNSSEAKEKNIKCYWSANEKTAVEGAIGMSYAGKRAMACMKHVGLNVAADPFINAAVTRINGGLIIVAADDPSMHSSQNEQDSRFYGKFAFVPILEPSNQQEAYDMVEYGFNLSEKYLIPVLMRIPTRLAHSRSGVEIKSYQTPQNNLKLPDDLKQFVLLPSIARRKYKELLAIQDDLLKESENSCFNKYIDNKDKSKGIIATGIAYNYLMENYDGDVPHPVLKISQYPIPANLIKRLYNECNEIYVFEEGYPLVEELLNGIIGVSKPIKGRLNGFVPRYGELNPTLIANALGIPTRTYYQVPECIVPRPPVLCKGCPHFDTFLALNEALKDYSKGRVFSDIGCYTLGALPPLEAINSCVDMGAAVTMAKGAADAGLIPSVGVIGDSTFTHSGITGLLDCVTYKSNVNIIILDNMTTAMTGGQPSLGLNKLADICKGIGVEENHIRIIKPLPKNHNENVRIIKEELEYNGVSVIISQRECIVTLNKKMREKHKKQESV